MSQLFSPLRLRELTFKNRVFVSPMCQYSSDDGLPTDWHLVHLGSRAVGGAALVMVEATSVTPEGRITPWDSGIWSDAHAEAFRRITAFVKQQGAVPGMQLAHAGRKASCDVPWRGGKPLAIGAGGWQTIGPSPIPFDVDDPAPRAMTVGEIDQLVVDFSDAAAQSPAGWIRSRRSPRRLTAICCTNFSRRCRTNVPTTTAARCETAPDYCFGLRKQFARHGRQSGRCSCAFPRRIGSLKAGIFPSRSNSRNG